MRCHPAVFFSCSVQGSNLTVLRCYASATQRLLHFIDSTEGAVFPARLHAVRAELYAEISCRCCACRAITTRVRSSSFSYSGCRLFPFKFCLTSRPTFRLFIVKCQHNPDAEQHGITELQRNRHRQRYFINQKQRYDGGHASQYHPSAGLLHPIRPLCFRNIPEAQDTR